MKPRTTVQLAKARRDLQAARRDLDAGDPENAPSRAYYAAFHAASAALAERRIAARNHSGVGSLFVVHFVDAGPLSREDPRTLSGLQAQREAADYGYGTDATAAASAGWVDRAEAFVAAVEAMLVAT